MTKQEKDALLLFSRDKTNYFIHNCTNFFDITETEITITLKEGVDTDRLREKFRFNMAYHVLVAFLSKEALKILGIDGSKKV